MIIIPTSTTKHLLKKLGNFQTILPDMNKNGERLFPDGEIYMKIKGKLKNERVLVLHSGAPRPNEGLIELELILQILRDNHAKTEVFFTYFPYGMQDKVFEKGETNVAENLIEKLVNYYRIKKIYIIDPHFGGRKWMKKYPIIKLSAIPFLLKKVKSELEEAIFLSPDEGGERRSGFSGAKKERLGNLITKMTIENKNLKGKNIAVVDDILETGGTLIKFFDTLKKEGAKKIIAVITHGVLPSGVEKVKRKYSNLYITNSVDQKGANVDISDLIKNIL